MAEIQTCLKSKTFVGSDFRQPYVSEIRIVCKPNTYSVWNPYFLACVLKLMRCKKCLNQEIKYVFYHRRFCSLRNIFWMWDLCSFHFQEEKNIIKTWCLQIVQKTSEIRTFWGSHFSRYFLSETRTKSFRFWTLD